MNPHPHNVSSELSRNLGHHAHYVPSQAALPTGTYAGSTIPTSSHVQSDEPIAARFTGIFFLFDNMKEGIAFSSKIDLENISIETYKYSIFDFHVINSAPNFMLSKIAQYHC